MSIASEITRIQDAKTAIVTAIEGKGQSVPTGAKIDSLAPKIAAIESGGTDTSDANATAPEILTGKTAYVNGTKITGTMPLGGEITVSGLAVNVPAGYLATPQIITPTDANLLAGNIKKDIAIFGVTGTFEGGGVGGGIEIYKCATVDTANKTWTGYKAILSGGVYSFEATATTGLTYTDVTPEVNSIYTADALARIGMLYAGIPVDALILYAPLNAEATFAPTGQAITPSGTVAYGTVNGIPCATFSDSMLVLTAPDLNLSGAFTISGWCKPTSFSGFQTIVAKRDGDSPNFDAVINDATFCWGGSGYNFSGGTFPTTATGWVHVAYACNGSGIAVYANGVQVGTIAMYAGATNGVDISIGSARPNMIYENFNGQLAAIRIYSRALSTGEIAALAAEFTPTA